MDFGKKKSFFREEEFSPWVMDRRGMTVSRIIERGESRQQERKVKQRWRRKLAQGL